MRLKYWIKWQVSRLINRNFDYHEKMELIDSIKSFWRTFKYTGNPRVKKYYWWTPYRKVLHHSFIKMVNQFKCYFFDHNEEEIEVESGENVIIETRCSRCGETLGWIDL